MTNISANFSGLPVSQERDRQPESPASLRPGSHIEQPPNSNESIFNGIIDLDQLRHRQEFQAEQGERVSALKAEISQLNQQLATAKSQAGEAQTDSVANLNPSIHVQERSRLQAMLTKLFAKKPELSPFQLTNRRKAQIGGITGAITGNQNTLMELNGNSAIF